MSKEIKEVNLMISINEIKEIIGYMDKKNLDYYQTGLKKEGIFYEIQYDHTIQSEVDASLNYDHLLNLLNAQRGLYAIRDESQTITNDTKFKVQLTKRGNFWTQW